MMPELGSFLLCLALAIALLLSIYPQWGAARQDSRMMAVARPLTYGMFAAIALAFLCLVHAFVVNDFTVAYVATNSNTQLPVYYRIAATWGAHEGSLLLWVLLLSCWSLAVALCSRAMPQDAVARVLSVMGMITAGFLLFIIMTSNPFTRTLPNFPIDGSDLNPLLQDIGLIFPPAAAVHGLCRLLGRLRVRHRLADGRPARHRLGPLVAPEDHRRLGVPHAGHRARIGLGLL